MSALLSEFELNTLKQTVAKRLNTSPDKLIVEYCETSCCQNLRFRRGVLRYCVSFSVSSFPHSGTIFIDNRLFPYRRELKPSSSSESSSFLDYYSNFYFLAGLFSFSPFLFKSISFSSDFVPDFLCGYYEFRLK